MEVYRNVVSKDKDGLGYDPKNVYIFGRSMGCGLACYLAANVNVPPRGLILMSPFKSVQDVASNLATKGLSWMVKKNFDNFSAMDKIKCPTVFIHGKKDKLIPWDHSETMY